MGQSFVSNLGFNTFDAEEEDDDCTRLYFKNIKDNNTTNRRYSGTGILEFSPQKAGMDVTPANYEFPLKPVRTRSATINSISGKNKS